jgi:nucleotide-binding universal stress UspA family protein
LFEVMAMPGLSGYGGTAQRKEEPMFRRIMVAVDLAHAERLEKAFAAAADLARQHKAELVFAGVTGSQPSAVARSPEEFSHKLEAFAQATGERLGVPDARSATVHSHDVTVDLDRALIAEAGNLGADLVVMGSHRPGAMEHIIGSNAGHVAAHAPVSVLVVRD